jgi:hypothetical protein
MERDRDSEHKSAKKGITKVAYEFLPRHVYIVLVKVSALLYL